jgi:hypothetical protein
MALQNLDRSHCLSRGRTANTRTCNVGQDRLILPVLWMFTWLEHALTMENYMDAIAEME